MHRQISPIDKIDTFFNFNKVSGGETIAPSGAMSESEATHPIRKFLNAIVRNAYIDQLPSIMKKIRRLTGVVFSDIQRILIVLQATRLGDNSKLIKITNALSVLQAIVGAVTVVYDLITESFVYEDDAHRTDEKRLVNQIYSRFGCYIYQETLYPKSILIDEYGFFSFLASSDMITAAWDESSPKEPITSSFLSDADSRHFRRSYIVVTEVNGETMIFRVPLIGDDIFVTSQANSGDNRSAVILHGLISKFTEQLQSALLSVNATTWSNIDIVHLTLLDLAAPKYYREELAGKINRITSSAIEMKEKCVILLYGLPGVSKTSSLTRAIHDIPALKFTTNLNPNKAMTKFLSSIRNQPKVVILEEIDAVSSKNEKDVNMRDLLNFLDSNCYDVAILTANELSLHPSLLRSGRCDLKIHVHMPDISERASVLTRLLKDYNTDLEEWAGNLCSEIAEKCQGFSHADLHTLCKLAAINNQSVSEYLPEFLSDRAEFKKYEQGETQSNDDDDEHYEY